jgi:hypothetical protein
MGILRASTVAVSIAVASVCAGAANEDLVDESLVTMPAQSSTVATLKDRFTTRERNAPDRESRILINLGSEHINAIFGGLGAGSGVGAGVELTSADAIPGVELILAAVVTTKLYRLFDAEAYFPSVGSENTHADLRFRYQRRPEENFFGIGPKVPAFAFTEPGRPGLVGDGSETNYDLEKRSVSGALYHDLWRGVQLGIYVDYTSASTYVNDDEDEPPIDTLFYGEGLYYPEPPPYGFVPALLTGSKILTEGVYVEADLRNYDDGLPKGFYGYVRLTNSDGVGTVTYPIIPALYEGLDVRAQGNDYGWIGGQIDLRAYVPLLSDKTSLAVRYFSELNGPKHGADIPFYEQARLGGRATMRGFDTYRFTGDNSILLQAELRRTVYRKDEDSGADVFGFTDLGQVWMAEGRGERSELSIDNFESDFGAGIQYRFGKKFTARLDWGHSSEGDKAHFAFWAGF